MSRALKIFAKMDSEKRWKWNMKKNSLVFIKKHYEIALKLLCKENSFCLWMPVADESIYKKKINESVNLLRI